MGHYAGYNNCSKMINSKRERTTKGDATGTRLVSASENRVRRRELGLMGLVPPRPPCYQTGRRWFKASSPDSRKSPARKSRVQRRKANILALRREHDYSFHFRAKRGVGEMK